MKLSTHLHIADTLHQEYEGYLNKFVFSVGNVLPDLWLPLRLRSHYEEGSGEFVDSLIRDLIIMPKGIIGRSLQLGIISHFIADFSCTVHKPENACSTIEHYIYEKQLAQCHETGHRDIDEALERADMIIYTVMEETMPLVNPA